MGRRRRKNRKGHDYEPTIQDQLESGTVMPKDRVAPAILKNFGFDDGESDTGDAFPGSELIDGVGQGPESVIDRAAQATPAMPLPSVPVPDVPDRPVVSSPPEQTININPKRLIPPDVNGAPEELLPLTAPVRQDQDRTQHLTWIVDSVNLRHVRNNGVLSVEIVVRATLSVARYMQVPVDGTETSTKEPALHITHLTREPIELYVPLWLFPPEQQKRPDTISVFNASQALVAIFANLAFDVVKAAPLPRSMAILPEWLRAEMARDMVRP